MGAPIPSHSLVHGDKIDPVWFRYLQSLDGKANASDIRAIATALGSPDGTVANIPEQSADDVRILQGAGIAVTRDDAGAYSIALRPLGDSGAGTFKLITRDSTGRISGSLDGTAADVPYDNTASGLIAKDAQAAIDELASTGGGSGMSYVGGVSLAAPATELTLNGLGLSSDACYFIVFKLNIVLATSGQVRLFYNGDTTTTNYYSHRLVANNTTISAIRLNTAELAATDQAEHMVVIGHIVPDDEGRARGSFRINRRGTALMMESRDHLWNTTNNPTSLTFGHTVANALGAGTRVDVWKTPHP